MVEPGPAFSVADVHQGWRTAFGHLGHQVVNYNLSDRLTFYSTAHIEAADGGWERAVDNDTAKLLAMQGVWEAAMRFWPHVVFITSGFYMPTGMMDVLRSRGMKVVVMHTESPYEDDRQLQLAPHADVNVVNDPTNLDTFQMVAPNSVYLPHSYDPDIHHPGPSTNDLRSDVCFVGTGYPSRIEFLEKVDWSGLDVILAGNWQALDEFSPLRRFVIHDLDECWPNDQTADLYRSTKCSFNLYRREANMPSLAEGYSMGPREVELSAVGCFWLRDPRPESDDVFWMLPSFTTPQELGDQLRWWCSHDTERRDAARAARMAVADWTFQRRAEQLLEMI
jgi:spore maturation protein CgeB